MPIQASVGMVKGKVQCYNTTSDQETVQNLLNRIPPSQGGAGGALSAPTRWGVVSRSLYDAIVAFQRFHRLSVDGHVDPQGGAIRKMEMLAGIGAAPTSERAGAEDSGVISGPTRRPKCGGLRVVQSGFLPATIRAAGGDIAQVKIVGAPGTAVELEVTSPLSTRDTLRIPLGARVVAGSTWDIGRPPPNLWVVKATVSSSVGPVRYEFLTDWTTGDPICEP